MDLSQLDIHLIPDLKEQNDDKKSETPRSIAAKPLFQNTSVAPWSYKGIKCFDRSSESPIKILLMLQTYSEIISQFGSQILTMEAVKLRQRLAMILIQKRMHVSNHLPPKHSESSPSCNNQQDTQATCYTFPNNLYEEHAHTCQCDTYEPTTASQVHSSSGDSSTMNTDTKLGISQSSIPKKDSFFRQSNDHKRKDEIEFVSKTNKKPRFISIDQPQKLETKRGSSSPLEDGKNEEKGELGFNAHDLEKEKKSIRHKARRLNNFANSLCHIVNLHQAFLLEMMSDIENDFSISDDYSM